MDPATECLPMKNNCVESRQTVWTVGLTLGPFRNAEFAQGAAAAATDFPT